MCWPMTIKYLDEEFTNIIAESLKCICMIGVLMQVRCDFPAISTEFRSSIWFLLGRYGVDVHYSIRQSRRFQEHNFYQCWECMAIEYLLEWCLQAKSIQCMGWPAMEDWPNFDCYLYHFPLNIFLCFYFLSSVISGEKRKLLTWEIASGLLLS